MARSRCARSGADRCLSSVLCHGGEPAIESVGIRGSAPAEMRVGTHQHDLSVVRDQCGHAVVTKPLGRDRGALVAHRPAGHDQRPPPAELGVQGGPDAAFGPYALDVRHAVAGQRTPAGEPLRARRPNGPSR